MSSFIVEDKTINRIVDFCYWNQYKGSSFISSDIRHFLERIGLNELNEENCQRLGEKLLKLNLEGFYVRYGNKEDIKKEVFEAIRIYKFEETKKEDRELIQIIKSIKCLLYQANEGNTDKKPLFIALRQLERDLLDSFIHELPEYEKAIWG